MMLDSGERGARAGIGEAKKDDFTLGEICCEAKNCVHLLGLAERGFSSTNAGGRLRGIRLFVLPTEAAHQAPFIAGDS